MATELIDKIIDEDAIKKQLDTLDSQLIKTTNTLSGCAAEAKKFSDAFGSAKGINDIIALTDKYNQLIGTTQKVQNDIINIEKQRAENLLKLQQVQESNAKTELLNAQAIAATQKTQEAASKAEQARAESSAKQAAQAAKTAQAEQALIDAEKTLIDTLSKAGISVDKLNVSKSQATSINKLVTTINNSEKGSHEQLAAQYDLNYKAYNKLSAIQRDSTAGKAMQASISSQSKALKELEGSLGNNTRKVGDYKGELADLLGRTTQLPGALGNVASGAQTAASGFKALNLASPLGWITLLIGIFTGLFEALMKNAEFAKAFARVMSGISDVFETLVGYVTKAALGMIDFFKGIKDFPDLLSKVGEAIKENLINRFLAFGVIGKAIWKILTGDVKDGLKELSDGVIQVGTGITNVTDRLSDAGKKLGKSIQEAYNDGVQLKQMQQDLAKSQRQSITILQELSDQEEKLRAKIGKLGAMGASPEEQESALKELDSVSKRKLAIRMNLANQELAISQWEVNEEIKKYGAANVDLLKTLEEKKAVVIGINGEISRLNDEIRLRETKLGAKILNTELANIKMVEETNKKSQEAIISDNNSTLVQKTEAVNKIKEIQLKAWDEEKAAFEKFANKKLDIDKLVSISDAETLNNEIQKLGLTKAAQDELIKIIGARKDAIIANAAAESEINKKIALEQIDRFKKMVEDKQALNEDSKQKELEDLSKSYAEGNMKSEEYEKQKLNIIKKYHDLEFNDTLNLLENEMNIQNLDTKQKEAIEKEIAAIKKKYAKESSDAAIKSNEEIAKNDDELKKKQIEQEKQLAQIKQQLYKEVEKAIVTAINGAFDSEIQNITNEETAVTDSQKKQTDAITAKETSGVLSKQEAEAQKTAIDQQSLVKTEELEKQKKKIQKEKAIFERAMSLFQIGIDTATTVEKLTAEAAVLAGAIVTAPLAPATLAMIPWVIGIGAAQAGAVLAQPLPTYAFGTDDHIGGAAVVGDAYRHELALTPTGDIIKTPNVPTIMNLPVHTKVFPDFDIALQEFAVNESLRSMQDSIPAIEINAYNDMMMRKQMGSLISYTQQQIDELSRLKKLGVLDDIANNTRNLEKAINGLKKGPWVN